MGNNFALLLQGFIRLFSQVGNQKQTQEINHLRNLNQKQAGMITDLQGLNKGQNDEIIGFKKKVEQMDKSISQSIERQKATSDKHNKLMEQLRSLRLDYDKLQNEKMQSAKRISAISQISHFKQWRERLAFQKIQLQLKAEKLEQERSDHVANIKSQTDYICYLIKLGQETEEQYAQEREKQDLFKNRIFHPNVREKLIEQIELLMHREIKRAVFLDYVWEGKKIVEVQFAKEKNYAVIMKTVNDIYVAAVKCVATDSQEKINNLLINLTTGSAFELKNESQGADFIHQNALIFGNSDILISDFSLIANSCIGSSDSNFDLYDASSQGLFNCPLPATLQCYEIFELFF